MRPNIDFQAISGSSMRPNVDFQAIDGSKRQNIDLNAEQRDHLPDQRIESADPEKLGPNSSLEEEEEEDQVDEAMNCDDSPSQK